MRANDELCATGSIVGAAGVGCAFGQSPCQPTHHESFNYLTQARDRGLDTASPLPTRPGPVPGLATSSTSASRSSTPQSRTAGRALHTSPHQAENGTAVFGDFGVESQSPATSHHSDKDIPLEIKRRPSRLQRLASFTFSISPSPTQRSGAPDSTSLAYSSGSAAPFIPRESDSPPLPPNKLVKRSLSQHLTHKSGAGDSLKSQPIIDRPATRHKRLATLSRRSGAENESATSKNQTSQFPSLHRPFFQPRVPRDRTSTSFRQNRAPGDSSSIRRIYPDSADQPILVLAHSISPTSVEVDSSLPLESDTFIFDNRPSTPSGIVHFFSSPGPPPPPSHQTTGNLERRKSFSIAELLSRSPSTRNTPRKLQTSKGRRVTSAPTVSMHDGQRSRIAEQSKKRRDLGTSKVGSASAPKESPRTPSGDSMTGSETPQRGQTTKPTSSPRTQPRTPIPTSDSPASNISPSPVSRPSRLSATPSDNTSSLIGSDFEGKVFSSGDEDDRDKQSDSVYDSLRTGVTRSSSGFRGPGLETLFDKDTAATTDNNDPATSRSTAAKDRDLHSPVRSNTRSNVEEDGSNSTPARTVIPDSRASRRSSENNMPRTPTIAPSPPPIPEPLSLGQLEWDSDLGDDEHSWSEDDEEEDWDSEHSRKDTSQNVHDSGAVGQALTGRESGGRSLKYFGPQVEQEQKSNLFDWSEQQPPQIGLEDRPPPRPKTVHGKKNPGARGSRSAGRRTPSGLHARSQSVPVLADLASSRTPITSKFGTWGIGSKGVTEDWNEDFEFDDATQLQNVTYTDRHNNAPSGSTMVVPDTIRAQQTNVLANIGLLKEWGLLIEELKELRERSVSLLLGGGHHADVFDEVDAMIDLADQEADDEGLPSHKTPTHSPGIDFEISEHAPSSPSGRNPARSGGQEDDVFGPSQSSVTPERSHSTQIPSKDVDRRGTRSRKNSEAVAQSVIQALQARGKAPQPATSPRTPPRKVPFDTTTLRHIVPYVNSLSKKMKQILRDAEGLQSSPKQRQRSPDPLLRQAFIEPGGEGEETDSGSEAERSLALQIKSTTIHE